MKSLSLYRAWFTLFFFYNLVFLSLQIGFIFSQSSSFINAVPLPTPIYLEFVLTLFVHVGLYCLLSALQSALLWGLLHYSLSPVSIARWHITIWALSTCALLTSNSYFFPLSLFSRMLLPAMPQAMLLMIMLFSLLILSLLLLNALWFTIRQYPLVSGGSLFISLTLLTYSKINLFPKTKSSHQTNIIFIGIDSLSPNHISRRYTPTLARFTEESVLFKETISPLAHTYPAWASILTGLYPYHHQARYNLMPPDLVKSSHSMAWSLQRVGYQTIFATDDRRFNSIGKEFGFKKIIGPKLGANDVLLGTLNDFPLSNLLVNLPVSRWLFPYNYINRASYFSYYPQSFDKVLEDAVVTESQTSSPLFMAVHFTLAHWPYTWAESMPHQIKDDYVAENRKALYLKALQRVDQQVAHFLQQLQRHGYLENSLVVLLSDHGEAFYVKGSRQTNPLTYQGQGPSAFADYLQRKTDTALDMSVGHGSDLLGTDQYHCLLAFKRYKHKQLITTPKMINTRVALIDLRPTIQAFLGIPTHHQMDGISLAKAIMNNNEPLPERVFIMESGMLANQFLTRKKVMLIGKKFFTIDPHTSQLQLHKNEIATLDTLKLYAVMKGPWIVALYPDDNSYLPITLNLQNGQWIDDLNTAFAKRSPALSLLNDLKQFYKTDWTFPSHTTRRTN